MNSIGDMVCLYGKTKITDRIYKILSINSEEARLENIIDNIIMRISPNMIVNKTERKEMNLQSFDIKDFTKNINAEIWSKGKDGSIKFDHNDFKLVTYTIINENEKIYYVINTYQYPNGIISLGKHNTGITKYPLKDNTINIKFYSKKEDKNKTKKLIGKKTADDLRKQLVKNGYQKIT